MPTRSPIEVQGHRGACGLLPENTLPSFEIALDLGVTSIETDVLLTRDDQVVIFHDFHITNRVCSDLLADTKLAVRSLTLEQVRTFHVDGRAKPAPMPLAERFARERRIDPYGIPTLTDFFDFVADYAGALGEQVGKTAGQRVRAQSVILDVELKHVPFHAHLVGAATLERLVAQAMRQCGVLERARVRSFDHRSVRAIKQLEPSLRTAILIYETTPARIAPLLEAARAELYCPDYLFVDAEVVGQVHAAGGRIIPYTVNEPSVWEPLFAWGVDGVTTDYPDRVLTWLAERAMAVM